MSQRGRKSRASLSVVPVIPGARPPAPVELDEAESRIWDAVLRSMRQGLVLAGNRPPAEGLLHRMRDRRAPRAQAPRVARVLPQRPLLFPSDDRAPAVSEDLDLVGNEVEAHAAKQSSRRD
jgi:hypothetical protein